MNFILSHWHCILPIAGIAIALLVMGRGDRKTKRREYTEANGRVQNRRNQE